MKIVDRPLLKQQKRSRESQAINAIQLTSSWTRRNFTKMNNAFFEIVRKKSNFQIGVMLSNNNQVHVVDQQQILLQLNSHNQQHLKSVQSIHAVIIHSSGRPSVHVQ